MFMECLFNWCQNPIFTEIEGEAFDFGEKTAIIKTEWIFFRP
jgi:hypothetical protein